MVQQQQGSHNASATLAVAYKMEPDHESMPGKRQKKTTTPESVSSMYTRPIDKRLSTTVICGSRLLNKRESYNKVRHPAVASIIACTNDPVVLAVAVSAACTLQARLKKTECLHLVKAQQQAVASTTPYFLCIVWFVTGEVRKRMGEVRKLMEER